MNRSLKDHQTGLILLAPAAVIFFIFVLIPLAYTLYLSFFDWNMVALKKTFVGLNNYIQVLSDPQLQKILGNTLFYIVLLLAINFVVPYIFAFVLHHILRRFQNVFKVGFFLPAFISLVVGSVIFTWLLNPVSGPISIIAGWIGVKLPFWSTTEGVVIVVISLITSWKVFGYNFITLYAAVTGVSPEIIEAARLDDIPMHRIFTDIVIPATSSSGIYIMIMTIVQGLQFVYTLINVITKGGPNSGSANLIYEAYRQAFIVFKTGRSSAISILTLILFGLLLALEFHFVERKVFYEN